MGVATRPRYVEARVRGSSWVRGGSARACRRIALDRYRLLGLVVGYPGRFVAREGRSFQDLSSEQAHTSC